MLDTTKKEPKINYWWLLFAITVAVAGATGFLILASIVQNDSGQFLSGAIISATMVTPDAAIWMAVALPILITRHKITITDVILIATMIALAHQIYGMLGLGLRMAGGPVEQFALPAIMLVVTYLVWGFVTNESIGDDDDDADEKARKLMKYGIISLAAFLGIYTGVSIDEMFAVLGRVEWMRAQAWNEVVMLENITVAMGLLWAALTIQGLFIYGLVKAFGNTDPMQWLEKNGDFIMAGVYSLLIYFVSRGWYQNVFGNNPSELDFGQFETGFAPIVYLVGGLLLFIVWRLALRLEPVKKFAEWFFGPLEDFMDSLEDWSEQRADSSLKAKATDSTS